MRRIGVWAGQVGLVVALAACGSDQAPEPIDVAALPSPGDSTDRVPPAEADSRCAAVDGLFYGPEAAFGSGDMTWGLQRFDEVVALFEEAAPSLSAAFAVPGSVDDATLEREFTRIDALVMDVCGVPPMSAFIVMGTERCWSDFETLEDTCTTPDVMPECWAPAAAALFEPVDCETTERVEFTRDGWTTAESFEALEPFTPVGSEIGG